MEYTIIEVPNLNDSMSRVVLDGKAYFIRFTYNDTFDYWTFGIYNNMNEPIVIGIKIVPQFPMNLFLTAYNLPFGVFGVISKLDRIGRYDFRDGKAQFIFCPANQ